MPNQWIINVKFVLIISVTGDGNNQDIGLLWSGGNRIKKFRKAKDFRTFFCGNFELEIMKSFYCTSAQANFLMLTREEK